MEKSVVAIDGPQQIQRCNLKLTTCAFACDALENLVAAQEYSVGQTQLVLGVTVFFRDSFLSWFCVMVVGLRCFQQLVSCVSLITSVS